MKRKYEDGSYAGDAWTHSVLHNDTIRLKFGVSLLNSHIS